jgi:hypothetical protein
MYNLLQVEKRAYTYVNVVILTVVWCPHVHTGLARDAPLGSADATSILDQLQVLTEKDSSIVISRRP